MTTNRVQNADGVTLDLLGDPVATGRHRGAPEQAALHEVLAALRSHPAVSWCERMNTGAARIGDRFIRFGFPGCPDVLGQLKDGRLLGVEVKSRTGRPSPEQALFLERIRTAGGVAFVARSLCDVHAALGPPGATSTTGGSLPMLIPHPRRAP